MSRTIQKVLPNNFFYFTVFVYFGIFHLDQAYVMGRECGLPGIRDGVSYDLDEQRTIYDPGTVVNHSCINSSERVRLLGDRQRTCQSDGKWSGDTPSCEEDIAYNKQVVVPGRSFAGMLTDGIRKPGKDQEGCFHLAKSDSIKINLEHIYLIQAVYIYGQHENWFQNLQGDKILLSRGTNCSRSSSQSLKSTVLKYECDLENESDFHSSNIVFQYSGPESYWICEIEVFGDLIEIVQKGTEGNRESSTDPTMEPTMEQSTEQGQVAEVKSHTKENKWRNMELNNPSTAGALSDKEIDYSKISPEFSISEHSTTIIVSAIVPIGLIGGTCIFKILWKKRKLRSDNGTYEKPNEERKSIRSSKSNYPNADVERAENSYNESPYLRPRSALYTSCQHIYESIPALHFPLVHYDCIHDSDISDNRSADAISVATNTIERSSTRGVNTEA